VKIARSTYYYKPRGKKPSDIDLAERIEEIALDFPSYGYRRITAELKRQGLKVNHKRVLRLMSDKNLLCRVAKSFKATTDSSHGLKKYPNLIEDLVPYRIDQLWHADITYIRIATSFVYLAAIESSYHSRALSPAGAFGYWQFLKSTAQSGPAGADSYDWKMSMTKWKDERADLIHSTHSAAKYLAWMNRVMKVKLEGDTEREGFNDWLLTAAAYNAGPKRVLERLNGFGATSYWDVPLPTETERYVPRWMAVGIISSHREFYGVQIPPGRTVSFDTVKNVTLKKDLTINALAEMLNVTPRAVWTLNTQIPPEKSVFPAKSGRKSIAHTIYVPKGARSKFLAQLKAHGYTDK